MDEQNNITDEILFFNSDGEYVYGDSTDGIDASIAKMHDIVAKVIKKSPYVAFMYKDGWGMAKSLAERCPTFQELNFSDKTSVTLYKQGEYENGQTFYFNGQPTQMPKLYIKKDNASFNIDNDILTSDYANKNLVCLDDVKTEYTPKIITLVFHDMSIDETYIKRTFIFKVDSQRDDAPDYYDDVNRKYDYCTFDSLSTSSSTDDDYNNWYTLIDYDGNHINHLLIQPVELVSYTHMGNPRILTVKLNYGSTFHVYFNGAALYDKFSIRDGETDLIRNNVVNHSYYKQYSYKIKGGSRKYLKVTNNFDIELNNVYDDLSIDIYGHYKDTCDIKINTVGDCSVYDTYEHQTITYYTEDDDYSEEHYFYAFTNIMSPGYNYYTHKTHYNACEVSYPYVYINNPVCKIGQTFFVSVDESKYNKFYWKFTGTKKNSDGSKTIVEFDSLDYMKTIHGYSSKEDVISNDLNVIQTQNNDTADEFRLVKMKDGDYYGFFVPMDLKHGMSVESSNPMYPLNNFSIRNVYIEVYERYKPKTVTFYIYDDVDVYMLNGLGYSIYRKGDNVGGKFPYKKEIQTFDKDYYKNGVLCNGDDMNITCRNATDDTAMGWYYITDNNRGNNGEVYPLGTYVIIKAYDNMTVHLSLSKVRVASMYIYADSGISVVDVGRPTNIVPTDGATLYTTDATPNSPNMLKAHFKVSSSDMTADIITVDKHFYDNSDVELMGEHTTVPISVSNGTVIYENMRTDGYYRISFTNTIRYESKSATVMVMYSDGSNIFPKINGYGTVTINTNAGNSEFSFVGLADTTNTYTLSLVHIDDDMKKMFPSATVRYKQRITPTDIVSWIDAPSMTKDNSYTIQIGGTDAFGKAKYLDIEITPQRIITYNVKIVNTDKLCDVYIWDYVNNTYISKGDYLNITFSTTLDYPNKFKVKFVVKNKDLYQFYSLLYVSPSGLKEHESTNNKFNADGYAEYEDLMVASDDYTLTITPINGNIMYLTLPNNAQGVALNVTTTAANISNGSNSTILYKKYALGSEKVTFTVSGFDENVNTVELKMYGSNTDNINSTWVVQHTKSIDTITDNSISFDYKYKDGFYNGNTPGAQGLSYKYYKIELTMHNQSDYVFEVDTEQTEPCPTLHGQAWNIYITKTAPSGVSSTISSSDISLGENPTFDLNDTRTVNTSNHSSFSDFFYAFGTVLNGSDGVTRIILSPKRNLDEFLVGTYSTGANRYLKEGDVIKNLIKINANNDNYSPSTIYVDCVIGLIIILEWDTLTVNEMENGKITVNAPWNAYNISTPSSKLLYFNCKDSNDNILDVDVYNNFIDETNSFAESDIFLSASDDPLIRPGRGGTHTLKLMSTSSVSVGEYKIGVKYHTYKQISAIIKIASVQNVRYWSYSVGNLAANKGYILSTSQNINVSGSANIPEMISNAGTQWLAVRYASTSSTPYKFIQGMVHNENGESYTNISSSPTSGRNLQWGSEIFILVYSSPGREYVSTGESFLFAPRWNVMATQML